MFYPVNLLNSNKTVFPIFGDQLKDAPYIFNFSSQNPKTLEIDTNNFDQFQSIIFNELSKNNSHWGIGRYLEERANLLRNYAQIIDEGRIYHLGLDIVVPAGYSLHAPLKSNVYLLGKEEGVGNYGGFAVLEHRIDHSRFFSFYGHLATERFLVKQGQMLEQGEIFARIGGGNDSGGWFTHTHLQILTERAIAEGRELQGYIALKELVQVEDLFPSPYPLFRY